LLAKLLDVHADLLPSGPRPRSGGKKIGCPAALRRRGGLSPARGPVAPPCAAGFYAGSGAASPRPPRSRSPTRSRKPPRHRNATGSAHFVGGCPLRRSPTASSPA